MNNFILWFVHNSRDLYQVLLVNNLIMRILCLFILGLCIGSFLNVVIYRLPLMLAASWHNQCVELLAAECKLAPRQQQLNLCYPASHCQHCLTTIKWWANIPLLGYLLIGGKCYQCKAHIAWTYPLIELVTGLLFVAVGLVYTTLPSLVGGLIFSSLLISLMGIDLKQLLLPDELTLPLIWLGLIFNLTGIFAGSLAAAVIGAISGYLSLWLMYWLFKLITGKEGLGYGDFKLLAACGAWLGGQNLLSILLLASGLGLVYALGLKLSGRLKLNQQIPFGPFLGSAGIITLLLHEQLW